MATKPEALALHLGISARFPPGADIVLVCFGATSASYICGRRTYGTPSGRSTRVEHAAARFLCDKGATQVRANPAATPWSTMRTVAEKKDAKPERAMKSAPVGPSAAAVYGFKGDDVENQAAYAAWGGRSAWRSRGLAQALTIPEAPESADEDADEDLDSGVDGIETHMSVFTFLKIVTAISALYMCTNPWFLFYDAEKGEICPYTVICATTPVEMILLTGSRISAGVLYPSLVISIFSKCYATRSFLHHSWLGAVLEFEPTHDVHTYFGYLMLVAAMEHAILHCARFIYAKEAFLIWSTDTGRSGLIGCLLLLPIVLPMKFEFFRTKMSFQFRKSLHLLFLPLMAALCFHSPHFRYVGSLLIVWYLLDRLYFTTRQTFLIPHPVFEAVGRGTMVMLDLPTGYTFKAGSYIYVNSPMISRSEWHPFSIIQVPGKVSRAAFYAEAVGDWTQDLFHLGLEQPRLPLWITAAQPSLMEKSIYYDNIVLVCTGAGITPAVSIIERFAKRKNIHLLWMSRDGGMVALFEKQLRQVNSTVHLTGKQTEQTKEALKRLFKPSAKHDAGAMPKVSFKAVVTNDSFITKRSTTPRGGKTGNAAAEGLAATNGDPDDLDTLPPRQLMLSNMIGRSKDSSERHHRLSMMKNKRTDPVTLVFGRPDIGAYLTETFAKETEAHGDREDCGQDTPGPLVSTRDIATVTGQPGRQRSKRLDSDQKVSKEELMKADPTVVEARNQQRSKGAKGRGSANRSSPGCPLPWLVLYCGANPKVEEAIANTCDEVKVTWQKEYFGAW